MIANASSEGRGLRGIAAIMRDLHHTIALEIESARASEESLRCGRPSDRVDRSVSVSALDEDEDACAME